MMSSTRLPKRSESGPAKSAPNASPNNAALRTGASAALPIFHSVISDGAMNPIAAVSKPSSKTTKKHMAKMSH
jgi:hypothetical protein